MKILGIIPARGNSKGVPQKNLQLLNGKPLLLHAIDTACASHVLDKIIVSSDDEAILTLARSCPGVEIPFKRPSELAQDHTKISDVLLHLLTWLKTQQDYQPDAIMLLEPTSPLRDIKDLQAAVELFQANAAPTLVSVSPPIQHPSNMIFQDNETWQYCLGRSAQTKGRQDFKDAWFINGAVYLTKTDYFLKTHLVYDLTACTLYKMPSERAFDINNFFDLELARAYSRNQSAEPLPEREVYA